MVPPAGARLTASWMRPVLPASAPRVVTPRAPKLPWKPGVVGAVSVPDSRNGEKSTLPLIEAAMAAAPAVPHQLPEASRRDVLVLLTFLAVLAENELPRTRVPVKSS